VRWVARLEQRHEFAHVFAANPPPRPAADDAPRSLRCAGLSVGVDDAFEHLAGGSARGPCQAGPRHRAGQPWPSDFDQFSGLHGQHGI